MGVVLAAVAIFAVLTGMASRTTLWDRDEPRFAQATVEMIAAGDYLVPTFNGRLRADKPALIYWLMSLPVRWLGPTAVAARLGSAAAMALAALLTFAAARCLLPAPAGLWAMAVLAATPLAVIEGQAATADALLLAALTAALACFSMALAGDGRSGWPWLGLGVAVGLAQLAKGPVGLAVPALAIATTLAILRRRPRGWGAAGAPPPDLAATGPGDWGGGAQPGMAGPGTQRPAGDPPAIGLAAAEPWDRAGGAQPGESGSGARRPMGAPPATGLSRQPAGGQDTALRTAGDAGRAAAGDPQPVLADEGAGGAPVSVGKLGTRAALACLLGTAMFLAWAVPANLATGGELARLGIGKHVVGRALGAMEGHAGTVWDGGHGWLRWLAGLPFYLPVLWLGFAPWVLWLPAAVSAALGGRLGGERGRALLVGWTVPTFALMTLVATRLPHYVLPAWPALALAVGGTIVAERRGELAPRDRVWLRRGAWLLAPPLALTLAAMMAMVAPALRGGQLHRVRARGADNPARASMGGASPAVSGSGGPARVPSSGGPALAATSGGPALAASGGGLASAASGSGSLAPAAGSGGLSAAGEGGDRGGYLDTGAGLAAPGLALALVLAAAGGVALRDHLAGRYRRGAVVLLGGSLAAALVAAGALAPALERLKPVPPLAAAVRAAAVPGEPVVTFDFAEPSFIFYLGRWPVRELPDVGAVAAWAAEPAPGVLVLPRPACQRLLAAPWAAGLTEIASARGWNVAKGRRLELVALRRAGTVRR